MSQLLDALGVVLLAGGVFFVMVAAVGAVKLPDLYCRAHALGKAMSLGLILTLAGYWLIAAPPGAWWKLVLAIVFQLVTIPVSAHLFCVIAYRKRVRRWSTRGWVRDGAPRE